MRQPTKFNSMFMNVVRQQSKTKKTKMYALYVVAVLYAQCIPYCYSSFSQYTCITLYSIEVCTKYIENQSEKDRNGKRDKRFSAISKHAKLENV